MIVVRQVVRDAAAVKRHVTKCKDGKRHLGLCKVALGEHKAALSSS